MSNIAKRKVSDNIKRRVKQFGFILAWLAIFSIRIIHLDSDMPNYGIAYYQQVDEGPYAYLALNKINYGYINPDLMVDEVDQYTAPHLRTNLVGNLLSYITIKIFGKNYYGLRMSSIICMLLNYALIFLILSQIRKKYAEDTKKSMYTMLGLFLLLTFDFTFTLASRIVETSIYRMLFVLMGVYICFVCKDNSKIKYLLLGFISMFSVFGIYITNIFFVIACIATMAVVFFRGDKKKAIISMLFYSLGAVGAIVLCETYMQHFWNTSLFNNCLVIISNFSNIGGYIESGESNRIYYAINFFASSFNLYNPGILLLTLAFVPILVMQLHKKKDENIMLLLFCYAAMFVQTIFSEDFIIRKNIVIVPVIIFLVYIGLLQFENIIRDWSKRKRFLYSLYLSGCLVVTLAIYIYRFKFMKDDSSLDFSKYDKRVIFIFAILIVVLLLNCVLMKVCKIDYFNKKIACSALVGLFGISVYMNWNYIYTNQTYSDRNIMTELQNTQRESNYVVGQYMQSFSLYNDCIPVVNYPDSMKKTLLEHKGWLYFDYSTNWNSGMVDYIEGVLADSGYHLVQEKEFERSTKTLGVIRNVALYRVEKVN